jgi:hypothetical protein
LEVQTHLHQKGGKAAKRPEIGALKHTIGDIYMTFFQVLEFVLTWSVGILIWVNMVLWGFVAFIIAFNFLFPIVIGVYRFVRGVRS